ncbi:FAD:protein FMN transferase, partial [Rhizobium johnstonii]|uniref:FAD:protein FMN transferase n=1 Tax=Rhizobium johnstonii TaxID=3019933 RepID=UPI003F946820
MCFDLNGIAKGYGADQLAEAARQHCIDAGLFAIDGELRALGTRPDGRGWASQSKRQIWMCVPCT